jgi:hypothetical protein
MAPWVLNMGEKLKSIIEPPRGEERKRKKEKEEEVRERGGRTLGGPVTPTHLS